MESAIVRLLSTTLHGEYSSDISYYDNPITLIRAGETAWRASSDPNAPGAIPGPTLYFGFPVIRSIKQSDNATTLGFQKDPSFDNYTSAKLAQLAKHGFQYLPAAKSLGKNRPFICFPWAIVELYRSASEDKSTSKIFGDTESRALDISSIALSMLEHLARFADEKHDGQHIPPVVTITVHEDFSSRNNINVWLTYCEIVDERIRDHVRQSSETSKLENHQIMY
jgi:hypothetical protein